MLLLSAVNGSQFHSSYPEEPIWVIRSIKSLKSIPQPVAVSFAVLMTKEDHSSLLRTQIDTEHVSIPHTCKWEFFVPDGIIRIFWIFKANVYPFLIDIHQIR